MPTARSRARWPRDSTSWPAKIRRTAATRSAKVSPTPCPPRGSPTRVHLIAHLLRVPFDDSPVVGPLLDSAQRLEARLWLALKRLFTADAGHRPLLVAVENLEQCETDTINFLQYLAAGMRDTRCAIVGTATDELWSAMSRSATARSPRPRSSSPRSRPPRPRPASRASSSATPRGPAAARESRADDGRHAARDPRAFVRLLLESDVIVREGVMWRLDASKLAAMQLPNTYEALVAARLRVMEPAERRVLEMAFTSARRPGSTRSWRRARRPGRDRSRRSDALQIAAWASTRGRR